MSREIASRARVVNSGDENEHFVFFKISQPDYPENYVVETKEELISYLEQMEGDEEKAIVVTPTFMSVKDYNALPEFDGF